VKRLGAFVYLKSPSLYTNILLGLSDGLELVLL